jgi:hypothetical protein
MEGVNNNGLKNTYDARDLRLSVHGGMRCVGSAGKEGHKASIIGSREKVDDAREPYRPRGW